MFPDRDRGVALPTDSGDEWSELSGWLRGQHAEDLAGFARVARRGEQTFPSHGRARE